MLNQLTMLVARAIAEAMGDDFDEVPAHKSDWNAKRGGTPYRDINMPFQSDYVEGARAAIRIMYAEQTETRSDYTAPMP